MKKNVLVVAGPTAVGKTQYAINLALALNGEIISCDSVQLYKYMDIGSAKPTDTQLTMIKHHLVSVIDPREQFTVAQYEKLAKNAINDVLCRGKLPIVTGGTGLYLNSILFDMDFGQCSTSQEYRRELEELAEKHGGRALYNKLETLDIECAKRIHPNNTKRIIRALAAIQEGGAPIKDISKNQKPNSEYNFILLGLSMERAILYKRINERVDQLMKEGLGDEVKTLMDMGLDLDNTSMKAIGYKELLGFYQGAYDLDFAMDLIKKNTRHYAKRQMTWFKRYEEMKWFFLDKYDQQKNAIEEMLIWIRSKK